MKLPIFILFLAATFFCSDARPQDNSNDSTVNAKTIAISDKKLPENTTVADDYLDADAIAKLRSLCPELQNVTDAQIVKYRYSEPQATCFKYEYRQGPCGDGMKFFIKERGSIFGECDCKRDIRLWVYHEATLACYKIFSKGGCTDGQYMDLTPEGLPICAENPCASNGTDYYKLRGVCAKIGHPNKELCGEGIAWIDFVPNRRAPKCVSTGQVVTAVGVIPCKPGSKLAIHGKCHISDWDFGKED